MHVPIKVVALDVYGTILACDDCDYSCAPRAGLADFLDKCRDRGIIVVTCSDCFSANVRNDLEMAFKLVIERLLTPQERQEMRSRLCLGRFAEFFQLDQALTKDFSVIIGRYDIRPEELLVVGDNYDKDIVGALVVGANAIHCPVYGINKGAEWDFGKIDLDS